MILVTGVSGFIGKHLLSSLIKEYGARNIVALTSLPVAECPYLLHNDYQFDVDFFTRAGYDTIHTVVHAGAFIPKSSAQSGDWAACNKNIVNTDRLLKAHLPNLKKIVFLSTVDVYGNDDVISETSAAIPVSLYGASKLYCEKMIATFCSAQDKVCQILRIGHVYGPGEEQYKKIMPVMFNRLLAGEPLQIFGTGNEIRTFIYISDVIKAILQAIKLPNSEGVINIAGKQQISIKGLVEKMIAVSGKDSSIEYQASTVPGRNLVFDNSKMRQLLLATEISLDAGLMQEWQYLQHLQG